MSDRTYWHVPGARSWHAADVSKIYGGSRFTQYVAPCGYIRHDDPAERFATADRVPPTAHLCGNCARIIAARTDVEDHGPVRAEIFTADDPTMGVTLP